LPCWRLRIRLSRPAQAHRMHEGILALTSHGLVSIPRRRRPHAGGGARMRLGSRVPWTGSSARLYRVRGRAPSQNAGARRCCTCSPAVKAAGLVPSRGGCSSAGVVRRCDRRGVDGWALDGCPGQTARLTGVACLSVPCTPRAVLSHGRVSLTRVAAMDLNNSYGSARSADMQYGGLNTRFCGCIASCAFR